MIYPPCSCKQTMEPKHRVVPFLKQHGKYKHCKKSSGW